MKKYYIGLFILGLITLGLVGYVLTLGIQSRQDVKTEKSAQQAANKLNSYVRDKQKIPESLAEAGVNDVPPSIKYTKISEEKYKFCVTYKADKGYGSSDLTSVITNAAASRVYGGDSSFSDTSSYEPSTLYLNYTHKKGEDCQTVKPYIYQSFDSSSSSSTDYCDPTNQYYQYYKSYCSTTTTPKTTVQ